MSRTISKTSQLSNSILAIMKNSAKYYLSVPLFVIYLYISACGGDGAKLSKSRKWYMEYCTERNLGSNLIEEKVLCYCDKDKEGQYTFKVDLEEGSKKRNLITYVAELGQEFFDTAYKKQLQHDSTNNSNKTDFIITRWEYGANQIQVIIFKIDLMLMKAEIILQDRGRNSFEILDLNGDGNKEVIVFRAPSISDPTTSRLYRLDKYIKYELVGEINTDEIAPLGIETIKKMKTLLK